MQFTEVPNWKTLEARMEVLIDLFRPQLHRNGYEVWCEIGLCQSKGYIIKYLRQTELNYSQDKTYPVQIQITAVTYHAASIDLGDSRSPQATWKLPNYYR